MKALFLVALLSLAVAGCAKDNLQTGRETPQMGDVVSSILPLEEFRKQHNDTGPDFRWYPCDGSSLSGTPLGRTLASAPDFRGRYPRGFQQSVPGLASGETGAAGTTIAGMVGSHSHSWTMYRSNFDHGDTETGYVHNPTPSPQALTTGSAGGPENRPNSVVVYFYIRAR